MIHQTERPNPLASILEDAVARYGALASENAVLRRDVTRLRDELVRRDADDALRGARCACTGYQRRYHVAMVAASVLLVVAVIGWWR